jgi:hypothetical protein
VDSKLELDIAQAIAGWGLRSSVLRVSDNSEDVCSECKVCASVC